MNTLNPFVGAAFRALTWGPLGAAVGYLENERAEAAGLAMGMAAFISPFMPDVVTYWWGTKVEHVSGLVSQQIGRIALGLLLTYAVARVIRQNYNFNRVMNVAFKTMGYALLLVFLTRGTAGPILFPGTYKGE